MTALLITGLVGMALTGACGYAIGYMNGKESAERKYNIFLNTLDNLMLKTRKETVTE